VVNIPFEVSIHTAGRVYSIVQYLFGHRTQTVIIKQVARDIRNAVHTNQ